MTAGSGASSAEPFQEILGMGGFLGENFFEKKFSPNPFQKALYELE
jgi:hypothetical protein